MLVCTASVRDILSYLDAKSLQRAASCEDAEMLRDILQPLDVKGR